MFQRHQGHPPAISPDGEWIAYDWYDEVAELYDLRIIRRDGSGMEILHRDPAVPWARPQDWSPDLRYVLADLWNAPRKEGQLVLVPVSGDKPIVLKTWRGESVKPRANFSPNGKYVAFDLEQEDDPGNYDIFLVDTELVDIEPIPLVEHRADDRLVDWTPNGRRVLFSSTRTGGRRSLWTVEPGKSSDQHSLTEIRTLFENEPIGVTQDGSLFYTVNDPATDVYIAELDAAGESFIDGPRIASSRFWGSTCVSDWSPDRKYLAYWAGKDGTRLGYNVRGDRLLVRYSVDSREEKVLLDTSKSFPRKVTVRGPRWSPDGQELLVTVASQGRPFGIYRIDVATGTPELVFMSPRYGPRPHAVWSPDRSSIYFSFDLKVIAKYPLPSGPQEELYRGNCSNHLDVSPDGELLAFYRAIDDSKTAIVVMPSAGGEPEEVVRLRSTAHPFVRWTPDGEHLLFARPGGELWLVHATTREERQIGGKLTGLLRNAAMHPDGTSIAFTAERPDSELWVMENFLPER